MYLPLLQLFKTLVAWLHLSNVCEIVQLFLTQSNRRDLSSCLTLTRPHTVSRTPSSSSFDHVSSSRQRASHRFDGLKFVDSPPQSQHWSLMTLARSLRVTFVRPQRGVHMYILGGSSFPLCYRCLLLYAASHKKRHRDVSCWNCFFE